jgi:hypothetical protein
MLISISFLYIFGNLPQAVNYMLKVSFDMRLPTLTWIAPCFMFLLIILKLVVYYVFNLTFRKQLDAFIRRIMCGVRCSQILKKPLGLSSESSSSQKVNSNRNNRRKQKISFKVVSDPQSDQNVEIKFLEAKGTQTSPSDLIV